MNLSLEALASLEQFTEAAVPAWHTEDVVTVHRTAQARFVIHCQSNNQGWAAIERDEALEAIGLDAAQLDCAQFADELATRLGHHLSIRDLEALIPRLQAELSAREHERVEAVEVLRKALLQPTGA